MLLHKLKIFGLLMRVGAMVCFLLLVNFNAPAQNQELRIAAAADLKFAMQELANQFEKQSSTKVAITYGSSGNFFTQMQNGAPFDLFFSADVEYPKRLQALGLTIPDSLYTYGFGRIVLWMPADPKLDLAKRRWSILLDPFVRKIAIANPEHAPYGRAAIAAMQKAQIYQQVQSKLVLGENISQAAQFVQSGNAQAGIIALSLAVSPEMKDGQRLEIPASMYPPLEQAVVILKDAQNQRAAAAFLEFVKSSTGQAILAKYGFSNSNPAAQVS